MIEIKSNPVIGEAESYPLWKILSSQICEYCLLNSAWVLQI